MILLGVKENNELQGNRNGDNCHFFIKTFIFLFSYLLFSVNL